MPLTEEQFSDISNFIIKTGGSQITDELHNRAVEIVAESTLNLPDMAVLRFRSGSADAVDTGTFALGKALEVSVQPPGGTSQVLFQGEIVSLEPEFCRDGSLTWSVRGFDKSHRLHRNRSTRSLPDSTDSEAIQKVVNEVGLQCDVAASGTRHKHIWQSNQTDWEFVRERADACGMMLWFENSKLFLQSSRPSGSPIELEWRENLLSFAPRASLSAQIDKVVCQGWDPVKKEVIRDQATSASGTGNTGGFGKDGGAEAKTAFGAGSVTIIDNSVTDAAQAKKAAQSAYDARQSRFLQAEGSCVGNPAVRAGAIVKLSQLGPNFNGDYLVTSAAHTFSAGVGYETSFSIRGSQPDTLYDLLAPSNRGYRADRAPVAGVVAAIVTNLDDPESIGRVKVKYPWLDDTLEGGWARVAGPGAGKERGICFLPEVNDEVLVAFDNGDFNRPYVLGGLWNKTDATVKPKSDLISGSTVKERVIKSRTGHIITLCDDAGKEQIIIRDKTGKNEIVIDSPSNTMSIRVEKDIQVEAKGKVVLSTSGGDVEISGVNIKLKANSNLTMEASANASMKGATSTVEGTGTATLKTSAGQVAISGPAVNINNGALEVT